VKIRPGGIIYSKGEGIVPLFKPRIVKCGALDKFFHDVYMGQECWFPWCPRLAVCGHHLKPDPRDDRFQAGLCWTCHGTGDQGVHGSHSKELNLILWRVYFEKLPDMRELAYELHPQLRVQL